MSVQDQTLGQTRPLTSANRLEALKAALAAFVVGGTLIYAMGFSHPTFLHNAAHDWRHSMNFPCH